MADEVLDRLRETVNGVPPRDKVTLTAGEVRAILDQLDTVERRLEGIIENHHLWDGS